MLDSLFCGGNASKCKSLIKDIKTRVGVLRKKRNGKASLQRRDIAELLRNGEDQKALSRVDVLFIEENILAAYDMIEIFCDCILNKLSSIRKQRDCPHDIKEAVSSLIFAAARCAEVPELQALRGVFTTRYGDEFAIAARESLPDCGVSQQIIEKLSGGPPTNDVKLNLMREIAEKAGFQWDYSNLKDGFKRQQNFISSQNRVVSSHLPSSQKSNLDNSVVNPVNDGRILDHRCSSDVNIKQASMSSKREDLGKVGWREDTYERVIPVVSSSVKEIPVISNKCDTTFQEEKPKPFSSSRRNVQKISADLVNQLDGAISLATDCERTSIKQQIKAEVVDHSFNTRSEGQEVDEDPRQAYNRSWQNKNSMHTSGGQCKYPSTKCGNGHPEFAFHEESKFFHSKYTNGQAYASFAEERNDNNTKYTHKHANASFLEESNGIPGKYFGLESATLSKAEVVHRSKPTCRASYLNVDGENFQEVSEGLENRKLPDNYKIVREGSVRTGKESAQHGENGVQHSRHGGHNRPPRCRESPVENKELRMLDKPCEGFYTDAMTGGKSEYQDLSKTKSNMRSKSNKMHYGSTWYGVENGDSYHDKCRLPKNGSDYPSVEPSIKKTTGRKVYSEGFLDPLEGSILKKVETYPNKWDPTSQYIEGQIDNEAHNRCHSSDGNEEYYNEVDSSDLKFVYTKYGAGFGSSPAYERPHSRGSGATVYRTNERGVHDEVKHNIRRDADNTDRKSINRKCHEVSNASQQAANGEQHGIYYSVQETLYETNKSNLNSFGGGPFESQKHRDKGEQKINYAFRDSGRLHNPVSVPNKNLYESVDHVSDEEQNLQQSDCTKGYDYTYPQNAESIKISDVGWQTQENKPQFGRKGSLDSPKVCVNHVMQHLEMEDDSFQNYESFGLYMNKNHITGSKPERRHLDSFHWKGSSVNDNSTLPEHKRAYNDKREKFVSSLNDVHQSAGFEKVNRYHGIQSERKQRASISSDSYIQQGKQTNNHLVFSGSDGIAEGKESSPEKGKRRDIQHTKSHRTRSKQRTHEIQSDNQSESLEATSVKITPKSAVPPGTRIAKRDSCAIPSDSSINRPLPPLPPSSQAPPQRPPSEHHKSEDTVIGAPPQRPPSEHQRAVSMPSKSPSRSASLKAKLVKSSSDVGIPTTRHVHPKLPDYDDLTAQFAALKQQRQSSNSE